MRCSTAFLSWLTLPSILLLVGCAAGGDVRKPIPTAYYPAPNTATRVVVMLPGRGDSLADLQRRGIAQLIQNKWSDADVILTGLTMPFYREGRASQRLHDEIIGPALARGDRKLWLAGVSLGGMGALLYDQAYPDQAQGMFLLSPYLGDASIHQQISDAGGLQNWQPGPPQQVGPDTFQHELWRYLQSWQNQPQRKCSVWIAYGADEKFRRPIEQMTPLLSSNNVLMQPGGHNWKLWIPALTELLQRVPANCEH